MPSPNMNYSKLQTGSWVKTNAYATGSLGSTKVKEFIRTTVSVKTPNWRTEKKKKPLKMNAYSYYFRDVTDPLSTYTHTTKQLPNGTPSLWTYQTNASLFGARNNVLSYVQADDPRPQAINKLLDQIKLTKASAAVSIAEGGQTAALVANTAKRIAGAILALRKGNFRQFAVALNLSETKTVRTLQKRARRADIIQLGRAGRVYTRDGVKYGKKIETRVTNFVADSWLEYSYGWKPLLSDVYALSEAYAETMIERSGIVRTVYATGKTSTKTTKTYLQLNLDEIDDFSDEIMVRYRLDYRIPDGANSAANVFGIQNPLLVAWELVPFSFVADWFLPVGNALELLTATNGLEFAQGCYTFKHIRKLRCRVFGNGRSGIQSGIQYTGQTGSLEYNSYEYDQGRVLLSSFPQVPFPKFKDPRSISHGLSAIALLQSIFLRK